MGEKSGVILYSYDDFDSVQVLEGADLPTVNDFVFSPTLNLWLALTDEGVFLSRGHSLENTKFERVVQNAELKAGAWVESFGLFVISGYEAGLGAIYISEDGENWKTAYKGETSDIMGNVAFSNLAILVAKNGGPLVSYDALRFEQVTTGFNCTAVAFYGEDSWVSVGANTIQTVNNWRPEIWTDRILSETPFFSVAVWHPQVSRDLNNSTTGKLRFFFYLFL
jgi:hypothetical protein